MEVISCVLVPSRGSLYPNRMQLRQLLSGMSPVLVPSRGSLYPNDESESAKDECKIVLVPSRGSLYPNPIPCIL